MEANQGQHVVRKSATEIACDLLPIVAWLAGLIVAMIMGYHSVGGGTVAGITFGAIWALAYLFFTYVILRGHVTAIEMNKRPNDYYHLRG